MQDLEKRFGIILDCGVVSSNHIHMVLELLDNLSAPLSQIVGTFKSLVYHRMRKGGDKPHPYASFSRIKKGGDKPHPYASFSSSFWQRGFYDHIIRNEEDWNEKAKYIESHPIKEELLGLRSGAAVLKWH